MNIIKETFKEPCEAYYSIFPKSGKQDSGYKYRNLSPFEFKNILIKMFRLILPQDSNSE